MFNYNRILQRVIAWTDFAYSTTYNTKPMFPLVPHLSGSVPQQIDLANRYSRSLQLDIATFSIVQPAVLEIMYRLNLISVAISSFHTATNKDRLALSNAIYTLEHRLLSVRSDLENIQEFPASDFDLSKSLLLAAHLYLHLGVRELPKNAKMHLTLLNRLNTSLLEAPLHAMSLDSNVSLPILLWILFIGVAAAGDQDSRVILVNRLQLVVFDLQITSQDEFETKLHSVLWSKRFYDVYGPGIWREIVFMEIGT